jgi:hypothetical protein
VATQLRLVRFDTRTGPRTDDLLDRMALACATSLHPHVIDRLVGLGIVEPSGGTPDDPRFNPAAVLRLQRIARLREELDLSWTAVGLIVELTSRVEALEAQVRELERQGKRPHSRPKPRVRDRVKV